MFGYDPVHHEYHNKFPEGAVRTADDLVRALDEIADQAVPGTLYSVMQSGHIEPFVLTPATIVVNEQLMGIPVQRLVNADGKYVFLGDIGVGGDGVIPAHDSHRSFLRMNDAIQYSLWMKTDPIYKESVRHWHSYCGRIEQVIDRLFGPIGDYD